MSFSETLKQDLERVTLDAQAEFHAEARIFTDEGLERLLHDLRSGRVVRGSWLGSPLSYRAGAPASVTRDRNGKSTNPFVLAWDSWWIREEDVIAWCEAEIGRRKEMVAAEA